MNMKSSAFIAGMITSIMALVPAVSHAAEVTVASDLASAYVWRGVTFNDGFVLQPSVDIAHESGLSFNVWGNLDLESYGAAEEGEFQEVDLTLNYAIPEDIEGIDFSVGLIQYVFPEAGSDTSTREVFMSASVAPVDLISFGADVYYDFDEIGGWYGNIGAALDMTALLEDAPEGLGLEISTAIGFADEDFSVAYGGTDGGGFDWNIGTSASYALSDSTEVSAFLTYTGNVDGDTLPQGEVDLFGGFGVSYSF